MKVKTVLVVGGAGFIGSQVNKMLHQHGYSTIVLDNLSRGNKQAVCRGTFIKGDIGNSDHIENVFKEYEIDAVMHFAALIDVGESVSHPMMYYRNNVAYTLNLLDVMMRYHVKTLIFSSSASVFGLPQEDRITEEHPTIPINPYGETKLIVEKILCNFDEAYNLKSTSLRYFNAAGGDPDGEIKNLRKQESNLIPIVLRSLLTSNGVVKIFGTDYPTMDGTCIRDYIHVCDLATAHIYALNRLLHGAPSQNYNLGNGQGFSVRQVIEMSEKVTGKKVNVMEALRRPGDPPYLLANSQKAQRELGWQPEYSSLESMIAHAWQALQFEPPSEGIN